MRILFMGNNRVGFEVLKWLKEEAEELAGLVLHPLECRKYGDEILTVSEIPEEDIILGPTLRSPDTIQKIKALKPDVIVSVLFDYILKPEVINIPEKGCINLHPSFLPYNRGQYPNIWSIVDGTPSGVTLHYIDEGVDTGEIIAQKEVPVDAIDTGQTLYLKLEDACIELFKNTWPQVREKRFLTVGQSEGEGTYHRTKDVEKIDHIDLDATYTGQYLIDVLRARTFPPYKGAYFESNGCKIFMRLELVHEENLD